MIFESSHSIFNTPSHILPSQSRWKSPANIALIKYWGKHGVQLPRNPSLSFTLKNAFTDTSLHIEAKKDKSKRIDLTFYFEGKKNEDFAKRIEKFLLGLEPNFPFLAQLSLLMYSKNSFPHSAGIASSASAMSALALCLTQMEKDFFNAPSSELDFLQKASFVARLGSGSASRSLYAPIATWGQADYIPNSSDLYASPLQTPLHDIFTDYKDTILIVSDDAKAVSSSAGHALMEGHPYADARYAQAHQNLQQLIAALAEGDMASFVRIVEEEAFALHGLMSISQPSFVLMKPETLGIIQKVQAFRKESQVPLCFTLDAGPNVHLLYPKSETDKIMTFIKNDLLPLCNTNRYIDDEVGKGPEKLAS
ncbi:MAG: diphosphomevalonate decarboxylase [Bernardetiaceae bacterium]|nr:diphosphomevalonate decarboxylase [Bernardetiaceae bacterium]